jgi:hypothetical protein
VGQDGRARREDDPLQGAAPTPPAEERGYLQDRAAAAEQPAASDRRRSPRRPLSVRLSVDAEAVAALRKLEQTLTREQIRALAAAVDTETLGSGPDALVDLAEFKIPDDADDWLKGQRLEYVERWVRASAEGDIQMADASRRNFARLRDEYPDRLSTALNGPAASGSFPPRDPNFGDASCYVELEQENGRRFGYYLIGDGDDALRYAAAALEQGVGDEPPEDEETAETARIVYSASERLRSLTPGTAAYETEFDRLRREIMGQRAARNWLREQQRSNVPPRATNAPPDDDDIPF